MWKILRPPKHKPPVAAEKIDKEYKRLRLQVFIGIFIGYAGYYLVRKNFTLAMPHLVEMGFDKGDLGIALSANAIAWAAFPTAATPVSSCRWDWCCRRW